MCKSWIGRKCIFHECWKKIIKKNILRKKSFSVFEGSPVKPFKHTKTFFPQNVFNFFSQFSWKMHFIQIQYFFHNSMHLIKKKELFDHKVFKLQRFRKVLPNVGGNALLWVWVWTFRDSIFFWPLFLWKSKI